MRIRRFTWALLPLLLVACGEDSSTVQPPVPLTPDEQVVANCRALRDALEVYAWAHDGNYPGANYTFRELGISRFDNPYTGAATSEPSGAMARFPGELGFEMYISCDDSQRILGYRITGYGSDRVLITLENLSSVPPDIRYAHDVTMANALLVLDALKRYAVANNGEYPTDVNGTPGADGKTLLDLLPNGQNLINPFSAIRDNPYDGSSAEPGGVGYVPADPAGEGVFSSFQVDAMGCDGFTMVILTPFSWYEEIVYTNCLGLRAAVQEFKLVSGEYPRDLDTETTPGGKTVLDICADHGRDFENPYTNAEFVPLIGTAASKGEVAYQPVETAGVVTTFTITGRGLFEEVARLGPWPPTP